jgi:predicted phage-related endonuclease
MSSFSLKVEEVFCEYLNQRLKVKGRREVVIDEHPRYDEQSTGVRRCQMIWFMALLRCPSVSKGAV